MPRRFGLLASGYLSVPKAYLFLSVFRSVGREACATTFFARLFELLEEYFEEAQDALFPWDAM